MSEYTVERYDNTPRKRKPFVIRNPDGTLRGFTASNGEFYPTTYARKYDAERHARALDAREEAS